ncbi:unnamed protein product [Ascophyllum nodosum]
MVAVAMPGGLALGVGAMVIVMTLCGFWRIRDVVSITIWFTAGVFSWSWAFANAGKRRPLGEVSDNVRLVRHAGFIITTLSLGSAIVGTLEAVVAVFLRPWWLQVPANVGLTVLAFVLGNAIFASSHHWVLQDPRFEPPMWVLDACVIS